MPYLFALIFICWFFAWFFLFRKPKVGILGRLREAEAAMQQAQSPEARRAAAKRVLDIIEDEDLAGVIVDDARAAAEKILRIT